MKAVQCGSLSLIDQGLLFINIGFLKIVQKYIIYIISRSSQWPPRPAGGVKRLHPDFIKKTFSLQSNFIFVTYLLLEISGGIFSEFYFLSQIDFVDLRETPS